MSRAKAALRALAFNRPIDVETRLSDDDHQAIKLWLRLLACTNKIEAEIRARFRTGFRTTLARFDLMAQLERNPDGLKMTELSQRMMVTGGNVTALTDQLEDEGLVVRESDPSDRRAYTVKLTAAGRRLFLKMAAVHEQWVIELFSGLKSGDKDSLHHLLGKLKAHTNKVVESLPGRPGGESRINGRS
jgi:DNA-binding MarR family transcriptional regulator